jgi:succinate dehydrogenase / fumarate reductase flavoprotein subunit
MLLVSECVARAALERQESRGGHTREDYPEMSAEWRKVNLVCSLGPDGRARIKRQPLPTMRPDLLALFEVSELKKYMTDEELTGLSGYSASAAEEKH